MGKSFLVVSFWSLVAESKAQRVELTILVDRQFPLLPLQPPVGVPAVKHEPQFPAGRVGGVGAVEAVARVADAVPCSEGVWVGVFGHVGFCGAEEGAPVGDGVGSVERESERRAGDHAEDETVIVEAAPMLRVEGMGVGGCPE